MVADFNACAQALGFSSKEVFAVRGNLFDYQPWYEDISPTLKEADMSNFDTVIVNSGFHHFENPEFAAKRLVARLKPGSGVIVVVDFLEQGGWNPQDPSLSTDAFHEFSVERVTSSLDSAGCINLSVEVFEEPMKWGEGERALDCKVFIAKGIKPANWPVTWGRVLR